MSAQLQEAATPQATPLTSVPKAKTKTVYTTVKMVDGRSVDFAGNRKVDKQILENHPGTGAVSVRFDFVNGQTRMFEVPDSLFLKFAGHGAAQKIGDEFATIEKVDDMVVAADDIIPRLTAGNWTVRTAGDSFSGSSVVIKAIMQGTGKSLQEVKDFLQKKIDEAKAKGEELTRAALYKAFRNPKTKIGQIVAALEAEEATKNLAADADVLEAELLAG